MTVHALCRLVFIALFSLLLTACGGATKPEPQAPLLPMPVSSVPHDPDTGLLMNAIQAYVAREGGPAQSRFEFTRLDLDDDGRREGLVMMKTPHQYWCSVYGCRMLVFKAHNEGFAVASVIAPVRGPMTVSENRTNGWRDIYVLVDGRSGWDRKQVALQFDGQTYPPQPAFEPASQYASAMFSDGVRIFP